MASDALIVSDLANLVEPLKREVAVPGTFSSMFPDTTDQDLTDSLLDAFSQVQLDGFLLRNQASDDAIITPDLSRGAAAMVVIYAGIRLLTADLLNRKSHIRYEANGAIFEQDQGASILVEILKGLRAKKDNLIATLNAAQQAAVGTTVVDGYVVRAMDFGVGERFRDTGLGVGSVMIGPGAIGDSLNEVTGGL